MLGTKNWYFSSFFVLIGLLVIFPTLLPQKEKALAGDVLLSPEVGPSEISVLQENTLSPVAPVPSYDNTSVKREIRVMVTAYSSTRDQTDDDPFITASGERVKDGIVANNLLPFGSKVRLPEVFGDKVFEVQDRMHYRKGYYHVDIWFSSTEEAKEFGSKLATLEVLTN